mmetsp:Transcript_155017/g.496893  ORF Transcript_155017/g.496893 Transcript_155017/m.496893 type:complete len:211 (+) Transcript_155017:606-1238(+)
MLQSSSSPPCAANISGVLPSLLDNEVSARSSSKADTSRRLPRCVAKCIGDAPCSFCALTRAPALANFSANLTWLPTSSPHLPFANTAMAASPFPSAAPTSPPASMAASAALAFFSLMAAISALPNFTGRSRWSTSSRMPSPSGSAFGTSSPSDRTFASVSATFAPASRSRLVNARLPCCTAIIKAVRPLRSFASTSTFVLSSTSNISTEL